MLHAARLVSAGRGGPASDRLDPQDQRRPGARRRLRGQHRRSRSSIHSASASQASDRFAQDGSAGAQDAARVARFVRLQERESCPGGADAGRLARRAERPDFS